MLKRLIVVTDFKALEAFAKGLIVTIVLIGFLASAVSVSANEAGQQVCTQVYGGGVVCGAAKPPHKPVKAGLGENMVVIGAGFVVASLGLQFLSRKVNRVDELIK